MLSPLHVLLVHDDAVLREALTLTLVGRFPHISVIHAVSGQEALGVVGHHGIDLVICDAVMPELGADQFIARLRKELPKMPVYVLTGHGLEEPYDALMKATGFIEKPIDRPQFIEIMDRAFAFCRHRKEVSRRLSSARSVIEKANARIKVVQDVSRARHHTAP